MRNQNKLRLWLERILSYIRGAGKVPILLRMTYRNVNGRDPLAPFNRSVYDPLIKKYSPAWFDHSAGRGTVDPHGFLKANPQLMAADGIHLNSRGYKAFRREIFLNQQNFSDLTVVGDRFLFDFYNLSVVLTRLDRRLWSASRSSS